MARDSHVSDDDLERYSLGAIQDEEELALIEEHLLICGSCVDRAALSDAFIQGVQGTLTELQEWTGHSSLNGRPVSQRPKPMRPSV